MLLHVCPVCLCTVCMRCDAKMVWVCVCMCALSVEQNPRVQFGGVGVGVEAERMGASVFARVHGRTSQCRSQIKNCDCCASWSHAFGAL